MSKEKNITEIISQQIRKPDFSSFTVKKHMVAMSDGTKLCTYVASADQASKPMPVILTRSPYGEKNLRFFYEMSLYGYVCVFQDCRGCYDSQGQWEPYIYEKTDGLDTLNWIISNPWCDGNIAMTGESYLSLNQLVMSDCLPKEVKTLNIELFSPYRYNQLYSDGVFHLEAYAGWTAYNQSSKFTTSKEELYEKSIHHKPQINLDTTVFGTDLQWYKDWVKNPDPKSEIWHTGFWGELLNSPKNLNIPILFRGGFYDPHFQGMCRMYENISQETKDKSVFLITPYNHRSTLSSDVEMDNVLDFIGTRFIKTKLVWFDYHLKNIPMDYLEKGNVYYYLIGANKWHKENNLFKNSHTRKLYLDTKNSTLTKTKPHHNTKTYNYNPENPVKTKGSEMLMINYMYQQNPEPIHGHRKIDPIGFRDDVISFESDTFENTTDILGSITAKIYVSSTACDTSFLIKISDVYPNGESYHLREDITSIKYNSQNKNNSYPPNSVIDLSFSLYNIAYRLKKGHKLRLDITSSSYPAYFAHNNTNAPWAEATSSVTATQTIHSGGDYCSYLTLPYKD